VRDGEEAARAVKALGAHRYVRGRLHLVHAFAVDAAATVAELGEAAAWARATLAAGSDVDAASRDERLVRPCSDAELAAVLAALWSDEDAARARLRAHLASIGVGVDLMREPFDGEGELDLFPVLIDAGWELLPLAELDPERHKGVLGSFDDTDALAAARFMEVESIPPVTYLQELPAMGASELLHGREALPLPLWVEGPEPYHAYIVRGVCRAARLANDGA